IADYDVALELDPTSISPGWIWAERAYCYEKKRQWDRAIADYSKAIELQDPKDATTLNNLAWLLATCPDSTLHDSKRAVELATKTVDLEPTGNNWNTLGVAQYRAGNWAAAIEGLNKSMELRQGGDALDWFVLAMAEQQRANNDQARELFDKAVEWM